MRSSSSLAMQLVFWLQVEDQRGLCSQTSMMQMTCSHPLIVGPVACCMLLRDTSTKKNYSIWDSLVVTDPTRN